MAEPVVSLYIPCYNVAQHVERCVQGVLAQSRLPDEILLIDDGSQDGTRQTLERLAQLDRRIQVIIHPQNQGLAATRNTGLQHAKGSLVAALDADTCPEPQWLATLMPHFEDPHVALVGGPLIESAIHGVADRWRRANMSQDWGHQPLRNPSFMFGHSQVIRKEAALAVNGYDITLRTNGEDVDMSNKLRARGLECIYDPAAAVRHYRTDSIASIFDTYWRWVFFGAKAHLTKPTMRRSLIRTIQFFTHRVQVVWSRGIRRSGIDVLALDMALPFYLTYRQFRYHLRGR